MYASCFGIVFVWIGAGTLFYAHHNGWPLSQAFFYAVDAGMSIGFCTEVAETTTSSRAFTVVFILLGASVVGGALALFVEVCAAAAAALLLVHRARWLALMRGKGGGALPVPGAHAGGGMQPAP